MNIGSRNHQACAADCAHELKRIDIAVMNKYAGEDEREQGGYCADAPRYMRLFKKSMLMSPAMTAEKESASGKNIRINHMKPMA